MHEVYKKIFFSTTVITDAADNIYCVHDLKPPCAISQVIRFFVLPCDALGSTNQNLFFNKTDSSTFNHVDRGGIYSALFLILIFFF